MFKVRRPNCRARGLGPGWSEQVPESDMATSAPLGSGHLPDSAEQVRNIALANVLFTVAGLRSFHDG